MELTIVLLWRGEASARPEQADNRSLFAQVHASLFAGAQLDHWFFSWAASSLNLLRRVTVALAVRAGAVEIYQAPPATTFLHALQAQIPTAALLTVSYSNSALIGLWISYLSTEWAAISCSLSDLELFDGFSLSRTVSSSVLSKDAHLLCSLRHYYIY